MSSVSHCSVSVSVSDLYNGFSRSYCKSRFVFMNVTSCTTSLVPAEGHKINLRGHDGDKLGKYQFFIYLLDLKQLFK